MRIAVIGGGVCGLTAAIELAGHTHDVVLFESAPALGGRTRSYFDRKLNHWVDHGPHLMTGAYKATRKILSATGHPASIHLQPTLDLPLWDHRRGLFHLKPSPSLPLGPALLFACMRLPGHGFQSLAGMNRLARAARNLRDESKTVACWMNDLNISTALRQDLLVPLCLGIMNEQPDRANARSFGRVIRDVFASHGNARLGWFHRPISQALVQPLEEYARTLGVEIHTGTPARRLHIEKGAVRVEAGRQSGQGFDIAILALPAWARNRLLNRDQPIAVNAIANLHLWFDNSIHLPEPLIGGIGTYGQWFFDINRMMDNQAPDMSHICAVISADESNMPLSQRSELVCRELAGLMGLRHSPRPRFQKLVIERRATVLVRSHRANGNLPGCILDAGEEPGPGDLPATIEAAVLRGKGVAKKLLNREPPFRC